MTGELDRAALGAAANRMRPRFEHLLRGFVETPSVSADPAHRGDIDRMAERAASALRAAGADAVVQATGGHPVVHARLGGEPGRPTVTVYNHLDVQPAARRDEGWRTDPFRLAQVGDRYFGRGTTDDKGPALAGLLGALAAREAGVAAGVHFLWELEEEIGSPHLGEALDRLGDRAATDAVIVSDTAWLTPERATSVAGLRGFVGFRLTLETAGSDRHSGDVGGAARNPAGELMALAARLHDPFAGRVLLPGFYEDVRPPDAAELREFEDCGFSLARFRADNELRRLRTDDPLQVMRRIWAEPTLDVHGMRGGYSGPGAKAIVPGRAELTFSCRLVPDQRPERIARLLRDFVAAHAPDVRVETYGAAAPYRGITEGPHAQALRAAVRFGFDRELAFVRDGGSIGAVTTISERLGAPLTFLGISLPEHGYHAPNENFDWPQARGGILAFVKLFDELARMPRRGR